MEEQPAVKDSTLASSTTSIFQGQPYAVWPDLVDVDISFGRCVASTDKASLRKQPDDMFESLQRVWTQHYRNFTQYLLSDPFITRAYEHDPRVAELRKQAGLPLLGRPLPPVASSHGR